MTGTCPHLLLLADTEHGATPIECRLDRGHRGDCYGRDAHVTVHWTFTDDHARNEAPC